MMLAVPPVAAAARPLAGAAVAGLVAADTHPAATRAPANTAMASMAATRFLCMTNLPLHQGRDWAALRAGSQPSGEPEPPFARAGVADHVRLSVRLTNCAACRRSVRESLREKPQVHQRDPSTCCGMEGEGHAVPIDRMQA